MIITLSPETAEKAISFASQDRHKYTVAAGIFPEDVKDMTEQDWNAFVKLAVRPEIDVIGEIGLDYYWEKDPSSPGQTERTVHPTGGSGGRTS
jgi:TatD DNase family protein